MFKRIAAAVLCAAMVLAGLAAYADAAARDLASDVIRFHVLANSDSEGDQALKIKVRDSVLETVSDVLLSAGTAEESERIIKEKMGSIVNAARMAIHENGYDYNVKAYLTTDVFPTREYGETVFPAGTYRALRVEIGEALGRNWWCVMFPPLCFSDAGGAGVAEDSKLAKTLTPEAYQLVTGKSAGIKVKFKLVELWEDIKNSSWF